MYSDSPGLALKSEETLAIQYKDWLDGFALMKIDFSRFPDHGLVAGSYLSQRRPVSVLDAHLQFRVPLPHDVTLLLFTSFEELLQIKRTDSALRDVIAHFSL